MSKFWKRLTIGFVAIVVVVYAGLSFVAGGPRDVYGMVRYALPYMHRGSLHAGDNAPDARLLSLDGVTHFHIRERISGKPLVLIFGSYT